MRRWTAAFGSGRNRPRRLTRNSVLRPDGLDVRPGQVNASCSNFINRASSTELWYIASRRPDSTAFPIDFEVRFNPESWGKGDIPVFTAILPKFFFAAHARKFQRDD
jgi:hypothetical protein